MHECLFKLTFILILTIFPTISVAQESVSLFPDMAVLEDATSQLTLEQVQSPQYAARFTRNTTNSPNFGRTRSSYWLRFNIHKPDGQDWYLLVDNPIDKIDAWPQEQLEKLPYRSPLYRLKLPPNQTSTVYLRVNNGQAMLYLPVKLMTGKALLQHTIIQYSFFAFAMTGLGVLLIYNLFLYLNLRDPSYLGIIGLIGAGEILAYQDNEILAPYGLHSAFDGVFYNLPLLLAISAAFYFWNKISQTSSVIIDRFSMAVSLLALIMIPFSGWWIHSRTAILMALILVLPFLVVWFSLQKLQKHRLVGKAYWMVITIFLSITPYFLVEAGLPVMDHHLSIYLYQGGSIIGLILLSITQTEHLRILREARERSDATSQAKDDFLTTMSHELRTPMNAVLAATHLLKQGQLPPREQGYITRLESASRHMLGLIDNILDLSRLEQAPLTLQRESFLLDTVLEETRQILAAQAAAKHLPLKIHAPTQKTLHLSGFPKQLTQVLLNLLGNAIKFTETGSINLYVRETCNIGKDHIRLYFKVADTGIGITPQNQLRLFQPFSQIDSKRTRHYGGSGLGLAISHKLVETMGGKLEMDSVAGEGSRFFFTLDFTLQRQVTAASARPPLSETAHDTSTLQKCSSPRILLVDDDEMNRFFGRELFNSLEIETTVAASGLEAVLQVKQNHFDLVFMDVSMPDMDGYETTRRIRAEPGFANLPIIALTAHLIPGERERCLTAGMNDYLTKPIDLTGLQQCITRWIS